jgi:hypothetical protein
VLLLFFDIQSEYATIILKGRVVEAPTVTYIPFNIHYAPEFSVWATGKEAKWGKVDQILCCTLQRI